MEQKDYIFEKLTPDNDVDISVYDEAIGFVFDNEDVTNIAISGAYGAGKSSVIKSYEKKHEEKKFMHISLAHFEPMDVEEENDATDETVLEGKILNQLIHQIPVSRIPQTNFRVKKDFGRKNIISITVLFYVLIGSITFLLLSGKIQRWVKNLSDGILKKILGYAASDYGVTFIGVVFMISSFICLYSIVKIQKNKNLFHKVTVQGNTIEIFENKDDSYFDKYLNEVLYLFEQVDADVIVFEDMDRFNSNIIFERLREVNNLTNIQKYNKFCSRKPPKFIGKKLKILNSKVLKREESQYKPLRFFYLLRDDIFVTKDRTKFFDYIIPIVPVLDGSNSYDQFIRHLKKGNIYEKFEPVFLQRLSLYIDDMRVLKNVYNELLVYMHRLNNTELNWDKMLAIIVYKNIFPRDFCNLQLSRGYVYELFRGKDQISETLILQLQEEKQRLQEKIDQIKNEHLERVEEVEDAYNAKYGRLPIEYYPYKRLTEEGEEEKRELEKEKARRKKVIEDRNNGLLSQYEIQIDELDYQISITKTKLLKELITRDNSESIFMIKSINPIGEENEYKEIKGSDYFELLKFLISNGYIDETYNDYMTYFYADSLSANDKVFLRRITDKKGADYEYLLRDVKKVLSSSFLRPVDFSEEEALNFDLLKGLLENAGDSKYGEYLTILIEQIKDKRCIDFVSSFYNSPQFDNTFIIKLNKQWSDFFYYIESNKELPLEQIRRFSLDTVSLLDKEEIQEVNIENCLTNYISNQADYLNIKTPDVEKLISQFNILNVRFKTIIYDKANTELFAGVYENNLYELTFQNIKLMINSKYEENNLYNIEHKNYTVIQTKPDSPLAMYIETYINEYIDEYLKNCGNIVEDLEKDAVKLINNPGIDDDKKEKYISLLTTVISNISVIENKKFWINMFERRIIEKTVSNIIYYYEEYSLDTLLVTFINQCATNMDYSLIKNNFGDETAEQFFDSIAVNDDIDNEKYKNILCSLEYSFDSYDAKEIPDDKMDILIKNEIIEMNEEGLQYMRNYYNNHIKTYIDYNVEEYLNLISSDNFNYEEALYILDMDMVNDDKKISLLESTTKPISIMGKNYSDSLIEYILINNFNDRDEKELYQHFSEYDDIIQSAIYRVAETRVDIIIRDKSLILDDMLLSELLEKSSCDKYDKIELWAKAIPNLNEESCKEHFDELGFPELKVIFTKRNNYRKTYEKNIYTTKIFEELKKNGWIYDYYEKDEDSEEYIVAKNETGMKRKC